MQCTRTTRYSLGRGGVAPAVRAGVRKALGGSRTVVRIAVLLGPGFRMQAQSEGAHVSFLVKMTQRNVRSTWLIAAATGPTGWDVGVRIVFHAYRGIWNRGYNQEAALTTNVARDFRHTVKSDRNLLKVIQLMSAYLGWWFSLYWTVLWRKTLFIFFIRIYINADLKKTIN